MKLGLVRHLDNRYILSADSLIDLIKDTSLIQIEKQSNLKNLLEIAATGGDDKLVKRILEHIKSPKDKVVGHLNPCGRTRGFSGASRPTTKSNWKPFGSSFGKGKEKEQSPEPEEEVVLENSQLHVKVLQKASKEADQKRKRDDSQHETDQSKKQRTT